MKHSDSQELKAMRARLFVLEAIVSGMVGSMNLSTGIASALADMPRKARALGLPRSSMRLVRSIQRQGRAAAINAATSDSP